MLNRRTSSKQRKRIIIRFRNWLADLKKTAKLAIICGGLIVVAVVLLLVLLPSTEGVQQASADGLPIPTGTPQLTPEPVTTPPPEPVATTAPDVTKDPTMKKGDENDNVQALQEQLMDLGYLDLDEPTQKFGPATETAVKWFQRQAGMEQTGVADAVTLGAIFSHNAKPYTLMEKTEGSDVDSLQRQLKALGYLNKVTGYYGTETVKAVENFQKRKVHPGKIRQQILRCSYSRYRFHCPRHSE